MNIYIIRSYMIIWYKVTSGFDRSSIEQWPIGFPPVARHLGVRKQRSESEWWYNGFVGCKTGILKTSMKTSTSWNFVELRGTSWAFGVGRLGLRTSCPCAGDDSRQISVDFQKMTSKRDGSAPRSADGLSKRTLAYRRSLLDHTFQAESLI